MSVSVQRVFTPLDGAEVARIIAHDVEQALLKRQDFGGQLTYPCIKWEFEVKLQTFPSEPAEFAAKTDGEIQVDPAALAVKVVAGARNVDTRTEEGQAPDQAREEAGLAVPRVVQTTLGKVDAFENALKMKGGKK